MAITGIEIISIFHGFLGTIFLMAFAGAFAELIQLTKAGANRIKWGTTIMAIAAILLYVSGSFIYISYRDPIPTSPKSVLLGNPETEWIHEILFELKEFTGAFVPIVMLLAAFLVWFYGERLETDQQARFIIGTLLVVAMGWTLMTYGLGAFVTKTVPLK